MNFLLDCAGQPYFDSKSVEAIAISAIGIAFFVCVAYAVSRRDL